MRRGLTPAVVLAAQAIWLAAPASAGTGGWVIQSTPNPAGAKVASLLAVSCATAADCTAVGQYQNAASAWLPLAEQWNGSAWAIQPTPKLPGPAVTRLAGVSCLSAASCVAVGNFEASLGKPIIPIAETWDGSTWARQPMPHPAGSGSTTLAGVSCLSASDCTAAGTYQHTGGPRPLIEHWDGSAWTIESVPAPPGDNSQLTGVSCFGAGHCVAVGYYADSSGNLLPLAEVGNAGVWVLHHPAIPAGQAEAPLTGVSCAQSGRCIVVGASDAAGGFQHPLAEQWTGTGWIIQSTPVPSGAVAESWFTGVSCVSAVNCTAVGRFPGSGGYAESFAEHLAAGTWIVQTTAAPKGKELSAVSCLGGAGCTAAGQYEFGGHTLAERN